MGCADANLGQSAKVNGAAKNGIGKNVARI
jgi:hypothetical protein